MVCKHCASCANFSSTMSFLGFLVILSSKPALQPMSLFLIASHLLFMQSVNPGVIFIFLFFSLCSCMFCFLSAISLSLNHFSCLVLFKRVAVDSTQVLNFILLLFRLSSFAYMNSLIQTNCSVCYKLPKQTLGSPICAVYLLIQCDASFNCLSQTPFPPPSHSELSGNNLSSELLQLLLATYLQHDFYTIPYPRN